MEAVIVAMGILMWTGAAACLAAVCAWLPPAAGMTRSAWLALALAIVAGALIALAQLVLPDSVLSQGWSRETLLGAQQGGAAVVLLVAAAALWRGHRQLQPPVPVPVRGTVPPSPRRTGAPGGKAVNVKRRH